MRRVITFLFFFSSMFALTIDEVKELAIKNSHNLKSKDESIKSKFFDRDERYSAFMPKVNLGYSISETSETYVDGFDRDSLFNISLSYNIFNGLKDKYSLELKELDIKTAQIERDILLSDTVFDSKQKFINLLQRVETKALELEALELLSSQLKDTESFYQNGLITKNDLLEVRVELSSQKQKLLKANLDIDIAKANLQRAIKENVELSKIVEPKLDILNLDEKTLLDEIYIKRGEIKLLENLKKAMDYQSNIVDSSYYPKVDFIVNYNRFGDKASLNNDEVEGKVAMSWELFDGFSKSNQNQSIASQKSALEFDLLEIKDNLALKLKEIISDIISSKEQLNVLSGAIIEAEENYNISLDRYKNAILTSTKLLDARVFLTRAKNDYVQAKYNLALLYLSLDRLLEVK